MCFALRRRRMGIGARGWKRRICRGVLACMAYHVVRRQRRDVEALTVVAMECIAHAAAVQAHAATAPFWLLAVNCVSASRGPWPTAHHASPPEPGGRARPLSERDDQRERAVALADMHMQTWPNLAVVANGCRRAFRNGGGGRVVRRVAEIARKVRSFDARHIHKQIASDLAQRSKSVALFDVAVASGTRSSTTFNRVLLSRLLYKRSRFPVATYDYDDGWALGPVLHRELRAARASHGT